MKILIVDDELVSRTKMETIISDFALCTAVDSGSAAVTAFEKALRDNKPFNIILLDINMPEMDGTETLFKIREIENKTTPPKEKQTIIIMVTSHSDKDNIITCIQAGCNDYVVKPFNKKIIREKLDKHIQIPPKTNSNEGVQPPSGKPTADILKEAIAGSKSGSIKLPSMPQINTRFKKLIKEGADAKKIANLLKQDVAISAKLISLSNSIIYRGAQENKTLEQAFARLGLAVTMQYVEVISNQSLYSAFNEIHIEYATSLWKHNLSCAYASQTLAAFANFKKPQEFFTLGLLHDIGKLMLLHSISNLDVEGRYTDKNEKEELYKGIEEHHADCGATILKKWKCSDLHICIARHHDHPETFKPNPVLKELLIVHLSNLLVKSLGYSVTQQPEIDLEYTDSAIRLELDSGKITETKKMVQERMDKLIQIIS